MTEKERAGYIKRDHMEQLQTQRCSFVTAWRIVDKNGQDLVQPWFLSKKEATDTARSLAIEIVGER